MHFDADLQNKLLVNMKRKKQKKTERIFGFSDEETFRMTLFQIMCIYDERTKKELVIVDKFPEVK
jgi:hypothetical protein